MLKVKKHLIVSVLLLSVYYLDAQQAKQLSQLVKETMELCRQGNYWKGLSPFRNFIRDSSAVMIRQFEPYKNDSLENVLVFRIQVPAIIIEKYPLKNNIKQIYLSSANLILTAPRKV